MGDGAVRFLHETAEWSNSNYCWNHAEFSADLASIHFRRGELVNSMASLGFELRQETVLSVLVQDITKSSEIEADFLNVAQVRSSIARRLGMDHAGLPEPDRHVDGVVEMMLDATQRFEAALDEERIFGWHSALFSSGRSGMYRIRVGTWRDDSHGPMQVVSGPLGKETVHFQAPSSDRVPAEMARFLYWFDTEQMDPVLKAAIAHLWFVTIHPMDDGNGRIGRAIMDLALARADKTNQRFYSMSAQINKQRRSYYDILERSQRTLSMDVTPWIEWFLNCMKNALDTAEDVLGVVKARNRFWYVHRDSDLNERQIKVINRLFEGFHGKLTTQKYERLAKCPNRTAARDIADLLSQGILTKEEGGGRNTSYILAEL